MIEDVVSFEIEYQYIGIVKLELGKGYYLPKPEFINKNDLHRWIENNKLKALIISAKGRHFSVGANVDNIITETTGSNDFDDQLKKGNELLNAIEDLEIPVIAAINGVCFGGGFELALACHLRICTDQALFAFPEVNHNLLPGLGGITRLQRIISDDGLLQIILTGDTINAQKAFDSGIVLKVCNDNSLMETALKMAQKMTAGKPHEVIQAVMKIVKMCRTHTHREAIVEETRLFCELAKIEAKRREN